MKRLLLILAGLILCCNSLNAAQVHIFSGYEDDDNLGDPLRTTQLAAEHNFDELYGRMWISQLPFHIPMSDSTGIFLTNSPLYLDGTNVFLANSFSFADTTNIVSISNGQITVDGIPLLSGGSDITNIANYFIVTNVTVLETLVSNYTITTNLTVLETNISNVTITTNLFVTDNSYFTTTYITNLYTTITVSSNSVSGNIQGPVGYLSMFTPDTFSLGASILHQTDTNTLAVEGADSGVITLERVTADPAIYWGSTNTALFVNGTNLKYENTNSLGFIILDKLHSIAASITAGPIGAIFQSSTTNTVLQNSVTGIVIDGADIVPKLAGTKFGRADYPFGASYWNGTLTVSNSAPIFQAVSGGNTLQAGVGSGVPYLSGTSLLEFFAGTGAGLILDSGGHSIYPTGPGVGQTLGLGTNNFGAAMLGSTNAWAFLGQTVPAGVTNLQVTVNGNKYQIIATPIP